MRVIRFLFAFAFLVMLLVGAGTFYIALRQPSTPSIAGTAAVASLESIDLGGVRQTILVRGVDRDKPVLLYVHGGPGAGMLPLVHLWSGEIEKTRADMLLAAAELNFEEAATLRDRLKNLETIELSR